MKKNKNRKCIRCKQEYPKKFINIITIYPPMQRIGVCPECALIMRNKKHRLPLKTPFVGKKARALYNEFMKYKENLK